MDIPDSSVPEFNSELPCENCLNNKRVGKYKFLHTRIGDENFDSLDPTGFEQVYIAWKCIVCSDVCFTDYPSIGFS